MKKTVKYKINGTTVENTYSYIPLRYIVAVGLTVLEVLAIIGIVVALCVYVPYFYIMALLTEIVCVVTIIASDHNPDYKVPWLLFVLILPIAGFMLYFIFYSRKLKKKYTSRLNELKSKKYKKDDTPCLDSLKRRDNLAHSHAKMLCSIADTHLFTKTKVKYFALGEEMWESLIADIKSARHFIFMEYFIIEEGVFWNSILELLKEKSKSGVDVRIVFDDIGCMNTLPGNYARELESLGIKATPFSRLRGQADNEFNNRSHRKITVIDGYIGYTGGVNIADEYINKKSRFGHWKDTAIRLEGEAVCELTHLFLVDYGINAKDALYSEKYFEADFNIESNGYVIPFGDGPKPIYEHRVGKSTIQNMLSLASEYAYITTPYLIIDNDLCQSIESTALRGVDVRIIVPHIPDKKSVFSATRSFYPRLLKAGVKIYEYTPGFIHAKNYLIDGRCAMVGTINLDYRSLVHHFENGVWLYGSDCIDEIKRDFDKTLSQSLLITQDMLKANVLQRAWRSIIRIFAPLL